MPIIRLMQPYAVDTLSHHVREAAQSYGEECIIIHTYHNKPDQGKQPRCPICWNDIYQQVEDPNCPNCLGTGYQLGVKEMWRMWAIFTDDKNEETISKKGTWEKEDHNFQCESYPTIMEHDFVIRVKQWSNNHSPLELGDRYIINNIAESTVRTGNRFGQNRYDVVGQIGSISRLISSHAIYKLVVAPTPVKRFDGRER